MPKVLWNYLLAIPAVFSGILVLPANANEATQQETVLVEKITQSDTITSVSQLSDVKPTDWAFQALQSLVERYGVITGLPNGTFQGNRSLTRYEFAAGLNAALDKINEVIFNTAENAVTKTDLVTLQKLQEEFADELIALRGKLDKLDVRTAEVEANQFSTTTKLVGEAQFVVGGVLAGNNVITKQPAPRTITLQDRVVLRLNTSFTGKDQLRIALTAGNIASLGGVPNPKGTGSGLSTSNPTGGIFGTFDGRTADNASPSFGANQLYLSGLRYRFPLTEKTQFNVFAQSDGALEIGLSGPTNVYFEGSAANGISRFSRRNMVYNYGDTGAGIAILHQLSKQFELGLSYSAPNGDNPTPNNGLFTGRYVAFGQLTYFSPSKDFRLALSYANTYSPAGTLGQGGTNFGPAAGSNLANSTISTNLENAKNGIVDKGTVGNLYGLGALYKLNPKFAINGFLGYSSHRYLGQGDGDVWNWGVGLSFPDLGKQGSLGGLFVGMAPKLTGLSKNVDLGAGRGQADKDTSLHVEAFYQYQLNDNIAITPGVIWITAPNSDASNPGAVVGWLRTTFRF
jgi:Carbohydrate-selective porin, OprB family/S-layer homology domain